MARLLLRIDDNMATPCSVNAMDEYRIPPHLEVTISDLKFVNFSIANTNIKSSGNRSIFLFTACFKTFVSTPYNSARSRSRITFYPRINRIFLEICSMGIICLFMGALFLERLFDIEFELTMEILNQNRIEIEPLC